VPSLHDLGWDPFFEGQVTEAGRRQWAPARVVWQGRERYRLSTGSAEWLGTLAGRLRHQTVSQADLPAVGDWVLAQMQPAEQNAIIHRRLARRSQFSRGAAGPSTEEQVVAANIDTVLLVTSFNRDFNVRRIERYLTLTWESGATPIVVLNKADLCTDHETWQEEMAPVCQGVPVLVTSALSGEGIADLNRRIQVSGTTALLGSSGVGKSTIVNTLIGASSQGVLPTRHRDDRGRHSTSARQLFCLPQGGVLIDTPGLRELELWTGETGLEHAFEDIQALAIHCRFRDCSHEREPGCAVVMAIERGEFAPDRLDSYRHLQREHAYVRSRHDEGARADRTRKARQVAKAIKLQHRLRRR
jgi:ribosome biogenesis GTPase / thiamine phosphate phosphatase